MEMLTPQRGDFKEAFNLNEFVAGKAQQPLPAPLVPHEAHIGTFVDRCHVLCTDVLRLLALGLGIDEDWFAARHERARGPSGSVFRMLYYPNMPASAHDADDIRAGAHSDYGSVTLLFQRPGQPGLEILTDGSWSPVPVNPGNDTVLPILVNAGDLLSHWTNGLLKSAVHRVVFPSGSAGDRYSLAYFCHPLDDAELVPVPSKLVAGHDRPVLTAQQHLEARLAATMALKGA
ncbi:Clavaminate synthase-like protein [Trichodelitschia bisporula]|uniref:Clavaminate synthase-like protein n=1 Tax=Trichodelitschia bisporula TaxID=703511 RepID=A0A6G1HKZ9_9PEZI|nr:Clavaminate synthase-like protein [Trichodelitschia bisporula]